MRRKTDALFIDKKERCSIIWFEIVDTTSFLRFCKMEEQENFMDSTRREITKIAREVSKFTVRTMRAEGIGSGEFDVLHAIRKNPGITQAQVCRITGLDKGAVARQTQSLEDKGYLKREANPSDGRSRLLYATEKAENLKNSKAQIEACFYEWLLEELQEEEKEAFCAVLEKLYQRCKTESKSEFVHMEKVLTGHKKNKSEKA